MSTPDLSTASRSHPKSKEDPKSAGNRSFDIDGKFCGVLGLAPSNAGGKITFVGEDPILPSRHRLGACISIPMMASAVGAATIWRMPSGRGQDLQLDLRNAIQGGATAVGVGRPYAWGLALDGTDGVAPVLRYLLVEADLLMAIDGYPTIGDLRSATLMRS